MPEGRHPFQRSRNTKKPVRTPFQRELVEAMKSYGVDSKKISGRRLSLLLGRSSNMVSQLMNDGLVPAGETVLEIAEVLELDRAGTDRLIRAGMETKASQRSRDSFWISQSARMLREAEGEIARLRGFIAASGLLEAYEQYLAEQKRGRKRKRKRRDS
jgi:hypothetical protein